MKLSPEKEGAHLEARLRRRGSGVELSTAVLARMGFFKPFLRLRGAVAVGTHITRTPFGTVEVTGRAGQGHAGLLEAILWNLTGEPVMQPDGGLLIRAPESAVRADMSKGSKICSDMIATKLDELKTASFKAVLLPKASWKYAQRTAETTDGSEDKSTLKKVDRLSGHYIKRWYKEESALVGARTCVQSRKQMAAGETRGTSQQILCVHLSAALSSILIYDDVKFRECRHAVRHFRSGPVQAFVRYLLSQSRKPWEQPTGGGYLASRFFERFCGWSQDSLEMRKAISDLRKEDAHLFQQCRISIGPVGTDIRACLDVDKPARKRVGTKK